MVKDATRTSMDPHRRRDILHSLAISLLACVLSGGLLWLYFFGRVWRTARDSRHSCAGDGALLVFGKRLVDGQPDRQFRVRLEHAARLLAVAPQRDVVLLGGRGEAHAGWLYLQSLGVPANAPVVLEEHSLDTLGNLRHARRILHGRGCHGPVLLLSNRYHLARCLQLAQQLRLNASPCAAEPRFSWRAQGLWPLLLEAAYLCWLDVGTRWARLLRHQRMLARVS